MKTPLSFSLLISIIYGILPLEAAAARTKVFLVGGFRATSAQMRCWEEGARRNSPGNYEFEGVPYPAGAGASFESAVAGGQSQINRIVAEINSHPDNHYVVAGHSSGCAIANVIATKARNPGRIRQVVLDGFSSPRIENVACWGAVGFDGKPSRNLAAMSACGAKKRVHQDQHCSPASQWCLHFALVIKSTPAKLSDFVHHGYDGCDANLDWLE